MLRLALAAPEPLRLLCLGAHPDDIEIGCGGTLLRLMAEHPDMELRWIVFSGNAQRRVEGEASARDYLSRLASGRGAVAMHEFRDGYFPSEIAAIKDAFEALARAWRPTLILTHCRDDLHQDHRTIAELTYNTFRDHLIWEYEIPKYDGDLGNPTLFVPLSEAEARGKVERLLTHFASQRERRWFTADTFLAMLRLRGIGCNAPAGYAEAFYCRKAVV